MADATLMDGTREGVHWLDHEQIWTPLRPEDSAALHKGQHGRLAIVGTAKDAQPAAALSLALGVDIVTLYTASETDALALKCASPNFIVKNISCFIRSGEGDQLGVPFQERLSSSLANVDGVLIASLDSRSPDASKWERIASLAIATAHDRKIPVVMSDTETLFECKSLAKKFIRQPDTVILVVQEKNLVQVEILAQSIGDPKVTNAEEREPKLGLYEANAPSASLTQVSTKKLKWMKALVKRAHHCVRALNLAAIVLPGYDEAIVVTPSHAYFVKSATLGTKNALFLTQRHMAYFCGAISSILTFHVADARRKAKASSFSALERELDALLAHQEHKLAFLKAKGLGLELPEGILKTLLYSLEADRTAIIRDATEQFMASMRQVASKTVEDGTWVCASHEWPQLGLLLLMVSTMWHKATPGKATAPIEAVCKHATCPLS